MNALQNYGSDSEDDASVAPQALAGPSRSTGPLPGGSAPRTGVVDDEDEDDDEAPVDPSDVFALNKMSTADPSRSSELVRAPSIKPVGVSSAVPVGDFVVENEASTALLMRPTDTEMHVNLRYEDMAAPIQGPENPFSNRKLGAVQNTLSGHVENSAMTEFDFKNQHRTFEQHGYARNPNAHVDGRPGSSSWVGDASAASQSGGATAVERRGGGSEGRVTAKQLKRKRKQAGDVDVVEGEGAYVGPWAGWDGEQVSVPDGVGPSEEEIRLAEEKSANRQKEAEAMAEKRRKEEKGGQGKSIFHGKSMHDYQGRTYMHIPTDVDTNLHEETGSQDCFIPKACVHTFSGHTKAISALRLFPKSGHLLLSSSMDTKVKLWDVYHEGNCLRTFMGHTRAVKDVTFSNDGRQFLSAGYDKQIKLWDTETGQCVRVFSNGSVPNCVKFHPDDDKQHIFLAGTANKKIIQFDSNTGEVVQEYDQHLGAVNTITFVDENRRFVTTSDDKTMRAWDFDIPVVVKYVADPTMHSLPAVTLHPNKKWLGCQSLDNQLLIYGADTFKQNRKKVFKGHTIAGYACQVGFSPDGKFVSSGDGEGNLVFWDWKSCRLLKRLRAHKEVIIAHEWLPHETSKIVTGSWDGLIKLWD
ncbi:hypothetical protein CF327_g4386 [Tilletia walkeri]|uniref:Pre-mRNA-processing factor 17 n=1 Tax=Tilletia walkeri TaxID=117179 RepID=A0A8X7T4R2_9BASI|nr:hypothetical protein CF327_g4386 [Tilletia walkeri]KAE8268706.1 hypothetical protein A4X09_0g3641 [Tilletia walkeri]